MLKFFAVEKNAAFLLLAFAIAGLVIANGPIGADFSHFSHKTLQLLPTLELSPSDLTAELLMTGFFLLVGLELKRELSVGVFKQRSALLLPGLAALFGALVPAAVYFAFTFGDPITNKGWGIPMATDLTFALAVFSLFGKSWPTQARTFVLAFAVIDDLIAIAVIALFISTSISIFWLLFALLALAGYWLFAKLGLLWAMPVLGLAGWYCMFQSGIQPAVVGVVLGLLVSTKHVAAIERAVHPWVSLLILPCFAFFATAVNFGPEVILLAPVAFAVMLRPIGKIVGINLGVLLARRVFRQKSFEAITSRGFLALSTLGGIGFSVALLIANQTFGAGSALAAQAIAATLIAMLVSIAMAALSLKKLGSDLAKP